MNADDMKQITLVPTAGLCNRMNAILSAIALRQHSDKYNIKIYWEKTKDCYADFSQLFLPIDIDGISISKLNDFYLKPGGKKCLFLPNIIRKFKFEHSYFGSNFINMDFESFTKGQSNIYITSYNRFCKSEIISSIAKYFRPTLEIEHEINKITMQYTSNTIGIHIRRTDNMASIKNSPIERFVSYMDKEIENDNSCKFYIATDDVTVKKYFVDMYKERVVQYDWDLSRNSEIGIKSAVAELYCLGRTKKIIGSSNSTYSETAARLYDIPLIL